MQTFGGGGRTSVDFPPSTQPPGVAPASRGDRVSFGKGQQKVGIEHKRGSKKLAHTLRALRLRV